MKLLCVCWLIGRGRLMHLIVRYLCIPWVLGMQVKRRRQVCQTHTRGRRRPHLAEASHSQVMECNRPEWSLRKQIPGFSRFEVVPFLFVRYHTRLRVAQLARIFPVSDQALQASNLHVRTRAFQVWSQQVYSQLEYYRLRCKCTCCRLRSLRVSWSRFESQVYCCHLILTEVCKTSY